jgi:putative heme-binding domain-containing protein
MSRYLTAATVILLATSAWVLSAPAAPQTGPAAEKRFPPLKLPPGFQATLFAADPFIEYPSAIALGPTTGSVFLAVDYMTGLGTEIMRRDEIRLLADTDHDGYADQSTVYATGFNSIQGLTFHDGVVYAMHSPLLTALRDTNSDGVADERRDLLGGLGLPPEENPPRLHCGNGIVMGYDGWLYIALGDHGCRVERPEGDRLVLEGGGILRCRGDGRDLHVFATGLRNIYDVALDPELNVFVRDNENDGGDYKIRLCHSFFGADHGYPYLYYEHPDEALAPLADLGLGSSAGGVAYGEAAFPAEYRGNLFFCEWGRAVVRYPLTPAGSAFRPVPEIEFAAGADNDPYGFKPTDLVVDRDGALFVSDWGDGQRPKRGRGRIYRITHADADRRPVVETAPPPTLAECLTRLDSPSLHERITAQTAIGRLGAAHDLAVTRAAGLGGPGSYRGLHVVWAVAHCNLDLDRRLEGLFQVAANDRDDRVRVQAVRAIADLADPVLQTHRLDAGPGDARVAQRLAELLPPPKGNGGVPAGDRPTADRARLRREIVVALGRLRWPGAADWLAKTFDPAEPARTMPWRDSASAHAVMLTLRRCGNWPAVFEQIDRPAEDWLRAIALRAIAGQYDPLVVDGLIERLGSDADSARRSEYADALSRVWRKPGRWVYWGYRPSPRPAATDSWQRTTAIELALDRVLAGPDRTLRRAVLQGMQRAQVPVRAATAGTWLRQERDKDCVADILKSLRMADAAESREWLLTVVREPEHTVENRVAALDALRFDSADQQWETLLGLARALAQDAVLARTIRDLSGLAQSRRKPSPAPWKPEHAVLAILLEKIASAAPAVRAAAVDGLAMLEVREAAGAVLPLFQDGDIVVHRSAAAAAGPLAMHGAADALLAAAQHADPDLRRVSLDSLRALRDARAIPLAIAALRDERTGLSALGYLRELAGGENSDAVEAAARLAEQWAAPPYRSAVAETFTAWGARPNLPARARDVLDRRLAALQGTTGELVRWNVAGPLDAATASQQAQRLASSHETTDHGLHWDTRSESGTPARLHLPAPSGADTAASWLAQTDVIVSEPTAVEFLASSNGAWVVWLNGRRVFQRGQAAPFQPDSDRFAAELRGGTNRLVVQLSVSRGAAEWHARFRRRSANAQREQLMQAVLAGRGRPDAGRALFLNPQKAPCIQCHRMGTIGERIGPDLDELGRRFSRVYIAESILEPSRTIAPSYETQSVALRDGRIVTGVRIAETDTTVVLADSQGQKHEIRKPDIEEQRALPQSTMPEGLDKQLSAEELIDLIAFLASQR